MLEHDKNPSAHKKTLIEEKMGQLGSYTYRESVCSSTAIVCLQKSEIGWAVRLSSEAN